MEPVLYTPFQIVQITHTEGVNQECHTTNIERTILSGNSVGQYTAGIRSFSNKVGYEHDQLQPCWTWDTFRNPSSSIVYADLDTAIYYRSHIVWMTLWLWGEERQR